MPPSSTLIQPSASEARAGWRLYPAHNILVTGGCFPGNMAGADAKMSEYFQRFAVPLVVFFIILRVLAYIYSKFFPFAYAYMLPIMSKMHHGFIKEQKDKLFSDMSHIRKDSNKRFFALEIGCGPGSNFGIYPANTSLVVVEPNSKFEKKVAENAAQHPSLEISRFLDMRAEDLKGHVEDASQDAVVSTLTLCSVDDIDAVVREVYRVLKPGGKFYFIEHTQTHAKNSWTFLLQRIAAPVFRTLVHCQINNTFWVSVDRVGFSKVQYTKTDIRKCPRLFRSHVFGYAVK